MAITTDGAVLENVTNDGRGPVFVSYRHFDGAEQVDRLESMLHAAGIPVWRDLRDLSPGVIDDNVQSSIRRGAGSGILVVTEDCAKSETIKNTELPELLHRAQSGDFELMIAVAVKSERGECDWGAPERIFKRDQLKAFKKYDISEPDAPGWRQIVQAVLERRLKGVTSPLSIQLATRSEPSAAALPSTDLGIRLAAPAEGCKVPPKAAVEALRAALPQIIRAVEVRGWKEIEFSGNAQLSVGFALGAAFPTATGVSVAVIDRDNKRWVSEELPSPGTHYVDVAESVSSGVDQAGSPNQGQVAAFVSLLPKRDEVAFRNWLAAQENVRAYKVIRLRGEGLIDPADGERIAREVADELRSLAADHGTVNLSLSYVGPLAIAVFIGRHLNNLITTIYEWEVLSDPGPAYLPVMLLQPGVGGGPIKEVLVSK